MFFSGEREGTRGQLLLSPGVRLEAATRETYTQIFMRATKDRRSRRIRLSGLLRLLGTFLQFLRGHIFDVSCDAPEMPEWILDETGAVSVELVLDRLQNFRARGDGAFDHFVDIRDVQIQAHRARTDAGSTDVSLTHAGIFVGQHDA